MTTRSPTSLGRVLAYLGATLLEVAAGDVAAVDAVTGVAIFDRYDDTLLPPGTIVLGVGIREAAETAALLDEVGRAGAAALIVRGPAMVDAAVRAAVGRTRVVLLELAHGASWTQIAALLRSILAEGYGTATGLGEDAEQVAIGGVPAGDLFALANAVSDLLDAPLTIEDPSSNVLAFSGRQEAGDQSRVETILGRQVPPRYTALLEERGVFRELYRSTRPVYVDPARLGMPAIALPRVAVAVRAGAEVIGSMWAVVPGPLPSHREQAFVDSAKLAAVHILHQRANTDVGYRVRAQLVATVLEGGTAARSAASRLGIVSGETVAVALGMRPPGLSYIGWVQWAGASERPPHLRCMISTSAAGRWQQEIPYTNGVLQLYFAWWVYLVRRRIDESHRMGLIDWDEILSLLPVDAIGKFIDPTGPSWQNLVGRDELDEFWSALRFDGRYDQIDVPCLHVTGWYDLEDLLGAFHHYEHMVAASPARDRQYLIVGPWSHVKCRYPDSSYADVDFGPQAALDMDAVHLRWFDRWLKGLDNGVDGDPRVQLFEPGTNVWRSADRWPLSDDRMTLYLRSGDGSGRLDAAPPAEDEPADSYAYDPLDPVPTGLDVRQYPLEDVPLDQTENEARPDVLTYTSDELDASLTISGWAWLDLFASSDCEDTDWHVKLTDVTPDGRSRKVTQGCLRASYRHGLSDPAPLEPDLPCRFRVEFWPTHHVFRPGHRIRVSVTSSDFPWFARNLNRFGPVAQQSEPRTARNTVHHAAERPSRLVLPVERSIAAGST